jgi:hypothetical protein
LGALSHLQLTPACRAVLIPRGKAAADSPAGVGGLQNVLSALRERELVALAEVEYGRPLGVDPESVGTLAAFCADPEIRGYETIRVSCSMCSS